MPKNLKKSLLITLDFPPNYGGVANYYYNVCKNFPSDKIIVLAPIWPGSETFDSRQKFTIIRSARLNQIAKAKSGLFNLSSKFQLLGLIKDLLIIIKNHKIEFIQIGQVLPLGSMALILKRRTKIPFIFYAHGMDITVPQKITRKKIIIKKIISKAKYIVANSYFTRNELAKLGADRDKVVVAYPCAGLTSHHVSAQEIQNFTNQYELGGKNIILTVGRLVERKGHDLVIKSLPEILKKIPNTIYLIAGDGPNKIKLQSLVSEKKLGSYVKFISSVSHDLLPVLYQISDVFVMPSRQLSNGDVEGFGTVYLEANLFGKPVIGGKSGGVTEAILDKKTGLLINPTSQTELINAVVSLLTDKSFAHRLGFQGMERAHHEFDWRAQTQKIISILSK
ncbi:MAG: glycosyltransferase family 4 protein [Candidatus Buchananbacteria bacterium]